MARETSSSRLTTFVYVYVCRKFNYSGAATTLSTAVVKYLRPFTTVYDMRRVTVAAAAVVAAAAAAFMSSSFLSRSQKMRALYLKQS